MIGVIFFHKNIENLYPWDWVAMCLNSIGGQTFKNFEIYELNYGPDKVQLFPSNKGFKVNFFQQELSNHSDAQNFILNEAFKDCDYVFNTNMDDFYAPHRVAAQLEFLRQGFDIVSSDMIHVNEFNLETEQIVLHNRDIGYNFNNNHNIIAHPACAYSKNFWTHSDNPGFQVRNFPRDDFELWLWAWRNGFKFAIVPEFLLYYRKHDNAVSNKDNAAKLRQEWLK